MEITALKLYHFPGSRSARVRWALLESWGDDFELVTMQLLQGEQYAPEFLALNPNHAVPLLEITWADGRTQRMIESTAMVEWLADAFPDRGLAPPPGFTTERANYLQMVQFAGNWMDAMLWQVRMHRDLLPEGEADPRSAQRALDKLETEVRPQLLARFDAAPFACGDTFTAADILVGHNVSWARSYGLFQDGAFANYLRRLAERPAFGRAFDDVQRPQQSETSDA